MGVGVASKGDWRLDWGLLGSSFGFRVLVLVLVTRIFVLYQVQRSQMWFFGWWRAGAGRVGEGKDE